MEFERFSGQTIASRNPGNIDIKCPHCRRDNTFHGIPSVFDVKWQVTERMSNGTARIAAQPSIGIRKCPNTECDGYIFVVLNRGQLVRSYPPAGADFDAHNLPESVVATLEEAVKCHAAGCYRAAALMIRRALKMVCSDKNAAGKNLRESVIALGSTIIIPPDLIAAAEVLSLLDDDAEPIEAQLYDAIEEEEVKVALDLTKELLKAVYQYNSLVARLRALKKA